jgi:hypothetical protein
VTQCSHEREADPAAGESARDTTDDFDVAIASTDVGTAAAELLSRYDSRWTIETVNQQAKAHGVGEARNRVQKVVQRTVPFGFLAQTITIAGLRIRITLTGRV